MNIKKKYKIKGFSLIELLIVIIIFGILSVIAIPSYYSHLRKARRADAAGSLLHDQLLLERCYSQNFAYDVACAVLPSFPQISPHGFYSVNVSNLKASTYTLTAVAIGSQAKDQTCAVMTVNEANVKTGVDSLGASQAACWNPI